MFHKGKHNREKQLRFSIRKVSFGAASVAVAALFMFLGNGAVSATEQGVPSTNGETLAPQPKDQNIQNGTYEGNTVANSPAATVESNTQPSTVENSPSPESAPQKVETLDKKELTDLIKEVDGKFAKGAYATKTEESVNNLRTVLEEARTALNNAKTQAELSQAQAKLVTATTKLQTKPEEKKEATAVDTTNGKSTVGKKATNTEKAADTNSIANSGSRDERNGKALNTNNPFRTDATTTNDDPSANQIYTSPAENADLGTLVEKLKGLDSTVENNTKLSQNMDSLGDSKEVEKGAVKEITEFGGWKAVNGGKFAIARKTEAGVYPLETINSTLNDTVWLQEQALDRRTEYTLLLSKSITRANQKEAAWDSSVYRPTGVSKGVTKNVAGYNGIEKTFTAYSTLYGSDVVVKFKPGYVGDSDGFKANYKVQVYSITGNQEKLVYETTFDPSKDVKNDSEKIVTRAKDGTNNATIKISKTSNSTTIDGGVDHTQRVDFIGKTEAEKLMAKPGNKPNGAAGTFTSKPIALPKGADHYKVRISLADQNRTGMSYQAWDKKYSLPVTGLDFSIAQDTSNVAKNLLQRIYYKLKATETADTDGKTNETKAAYLAELEKVKTLVTSTDVKKTAEYKEALESTLSKQLALRVDKTELRNSKEALSTLVTATDPTPGKTADSATAYNAAKQEAIKAIEAAKTVIDNENATVAEVRDALATVNAKKTALQQAKDGLIEAATPEEKTKLQTDSDSLKKADETGKTPESIAAYDRKYEEFKAELEAAKTEAAKALAKGTNATKEEVQAAQAKVEAVKTKLETAKNLLVEAATPEEKTKLQTDSDSLKKADETGKTPESIAAYDRKYEEFK
ncbi:YSIRK-type signal peptide-containing protein, partial [Streptococcus shenyangsis]